MTAIVIMFVIGAVVHMGKLLQEVMEGHEKKILDKAMGKAPLVY